MAKERTQGRDIVKANAPVGVPSYLANYVEGDKSLDAMKEYRILPRIKVIQSTANSDLQKVFNQGDVIFSPGGTLIAAVDKVKQKSARPFWFVPVFFFTEFLKMSDIKDKSSNSVVGRTLDPSHEIAGKAKNPETRLEPYGEIDKQTKLPKFKFRYVECLNFPGIIYGPEDHVFKGEIAVLQYSKGEFSQGKNFVSAASMRKASAEATAKLPLWSQVWEFSVGYRDKGADKKWWGLDHTIPGDVNSRIIKEDEAEFFHRTYQELSEAHEKKRIIVDHSDTTGEEIEGAETEKKF